MPQVADIVVAGAGIAGLAFALAVARDQRGVRLAVVDPTLGRPAAATQSRRALAIAAGPRRFLEGLGAWDRIAGRAQPILGMVITDSRPGDVIRPDYLHFDGTVGSDEPAAHMIFIEDLRQALLACCREAGLSLVSGRFSGFAQRGPGALRLDSVPDLTQTRLLVAADGGRSRLRDLAGIRCLTRDYGQSGIVATIGHERSHEGIARQHFLPNGPLAVLPMRAEDGSPRRFSLVWTEARAVAEARVRLPEADILAAVEAIIGHELGRLHLEDRPTALPLRLVLPRRLVAPRFALLGDAARTVHPLAGQGLNLGLRDAATLAESVGDALGLGLDPGAPDVLSSYEQARRFDSLVMAGATDGLNRLFASDNPVLRLVRDLGLGLVDRLPRMKQAFMAEAAGLAGRPPQAFRG